MTIHQKLERLTEFSNLAAISKAAGLGTSTLNNMLVRKTDPSTRVVIGLARVLGVDPGWLVDDTREWPPVRVETPTPTREPVAA